MGRGETPPRNEGVVVWQLRVGATSEVGAGSSQAQQIADLFILAHKQRGSRVGLPKEGRTGNMETHSKLVFGGVADAAREKMYTAPSDPIRAPVACQAGRESEWGESLSKG